MAPVDAAVSRGFDLSNGEFAAGGHRGIDYSVPEGTLVRASGAGVVSFAGSTREGPYVSITHDGGVKTTYSLDEIAVSTGQEVGRGTIIGTSGGGHDNSGPLLHFGALIDGIYIDPLLLLGDFEDITDLREKKPDPIPLGQYPCTDELIGPTSEVRAAFDDEFERRASSGTGERW